MVTDFQFYFVCGCQLQTNSLRYFTSQLVTTQLEIEDWGRCLRNSVSSECWSQVGYQFTRVIQINNFKWKYKSFQTFQYYSGWFVFNVWTRKTLFSTALRNSANEDEITKLCKKCVKPDRRNKCIEQRSPLLLSFQQRPLQTWGDFALLVHI